LEPEDDPRGLNKCVNSLDKLSVNHWNGWKKPDIYNHADSEFFYDLSVLESVQEKHIRKQRGLYKKGLKPA
jgi:hypothetical protein